MSAEAFEKLQSKWRVVEKEAEAELKSTETTLETSGEDAKPEVKKDEPKTAEYHGKAQDWQGEFSTRFECGFIIFSTCFECGFIIFPTGFECSFQVVRGWMPASSPSKQGRRLKRFGPSRTTSKTSGYPLLNYNATCQKSKKLHSF